MGLTNVWYISEDCTPEKKFGASLRASPWKLFNKEKANVEDGVHGNQRQNVDRKLFVTKNQNYSKKEVESKMVDEMVDILHWVSINTTHLHALPIGESVGGMDYRHVLEVNEGVSRDCVDSGGLREKMLLESVLEDNIFSIYSWHRGVG